MVTPAWIRLMSAALVGDLVSNGDGDPVAVTGGRGTAVEVAGAGEGLTDPVRADEFAVGVVDERAGGLLGEYNVGDSGDDQRVEDAQSHGGDDGVEDGGEQYLFHGFPVYAR